MSSNQSKQKSKAAKIQGSIQPLTPAQGAGWQMDGSCVSILGEDIIEGRDKAMANQNFARRLQQGCGAAQP